MASATKKRQRRSASVQNVSLDELRKRANLSIDEARRLTGFGRATVNKLMDDGDWLWFWEGKRRRIVTESIFDWQTRKVKEAVAS